METSRSNESPGTAGSPLLRPPAGSADEAAAVIAAIEQFLADTAPAPVLTAEPPPSRWKQAALAEGVARQPDAPASWR